MTRVALAALAACLAAAAAAYGSAFLPGGAPGWAGAVLAAAAAGAMAAVALLAVGRRGWSPLVGAIALGGPLLAWTLAVTWLMPAIDPADPDLALGLPARAAHVLYGVGLLPALVVPLLYAWTFDRDTLSPEALARFREAAAGLRGGPGPRMGEDQTGERPERTGRRPDEPPSSRSDRSP